jgi:hypothetical protein
MIYQCDVANDSALHNRIRFYCNISPWGVCYSNLQKTKAQCSNIEPLKNNNSHKGNENESY